MFAALNRGIAYVLIGLGIALIGVGVYLGFFAWLNDGVVAGVRLFGTTGAFGAGFALAGLGFRFAAAAHARGDRRRWWIQVLVVVLGYVAFGLAATGTSLLDRIGRS